MYVYGEMILWNEFSSALLSYFSSQQCILLSVCARHYNLQGIISHIHTYIQRAFYKKRIHIHDLFVQTSGCKANFGSACVSSSECCDPGVRHHHSWIRCCTSIINAHNVVTLYFFFLRRCVLAQRSCNVSRWARQSYLTFGNLVVITL